MVEVDGGGFAHGGIDLAGVADVETEGRIRQIFEDFNQIAGGLSDGLALVHVLDAEMVAQVRPLLRTIHYVRRIIKRMPQPIKIRGRFASVEDTAATLGVSPSRTKELVELAKKSGARVAFRSSKNGSFVAYKKMKSGSSATVSRTASSRRHAGTSKKKSTR